MKLKIKSNAYLYIGTNLTFYDLRGKLKPTQEFDSLLFNLSISLKPKFDQIDRGQVRLDKYQEKQLKN